MEFKITELFKNLETETQSDYFEDAQITSKVSIPDNETLTFHLDHNW
ncbi:hypothetical protein [Chryseobacterium schmidteae]|nr:hypothetical protein [Chryseobacterium schmidteae]